MSTKIFVNLPVKDLDKTKAYYGALGYSFNAQFSDETAACMVISEDIYAMLLTEDKFRQFTPHPISDAHKATEVLLALSFESKDKVNEIVAKALAAGGAEVKPPQDHGFMFSRSIADLDGHIWEIFWMDPAAVQQG